MHGPINVKYRPVNPLWENIHSLIKKMYNAYAANLVLLKQVVHIDTTGI
jgi:hypothetical protein